MSAFWAPERTPWNCIDCEESGMTEAEVQMHITQTNHVCHRDTGVRK